jgi:hypothetical protein
MPRHVDRETWIRRSLLAAYSGTPTTMASDPATVERWVGRLTRVVEADRLKRSAAFHLGGMGVGGDLAEQVLKAFEEAE